MTWRKAWFTKAISASMRSSSSLNRRARLSVELLEDRIVPTIFKPTIFTDGGAGSGSLRAAVISANADAGTSTDTIQLKAGTYSLTIANTSGQENAAATGDLDIT